MLQNKTKRVYSEDVPKSLRLKVIFVSGDVKGGGGDGCTHTTPCSSRDIMTILRELTDIYSIKVIGLLQNLALFSNVCLHAEIRAMNDKASHFGQRPYCID